MKKLLREFFRRIFGGEPPGYEDDDFGRRHGWWILIDNKRIGELEYVRWDEMAQFWHEYRINLFDSKYDSIKIKPEDWYEFGISLQNKKDSKRLEADYIPSPREGDLVAMRGL